MQGYLFRKAALRLRHKTFGGNGLRDMEFLSTTARQKVAKVLHAGQNILKSGIDTVPVQEIKNVTIVIGK